MPASSLVINLGPIAGRCFANENIEMDDEICIARAFLFSRLTYSAGSWHEFNQKEQNKFIAATMHVWRRTTQSTYQNCVDKGENPISDQGVILKFKLMTPINMVRLLRINLLNRLTSGNNSTIKAIVFAARKAQK